MIARDPSPRAARRVASPISVGRADPHVPPPRGRPVRNLPSSAGADGVGRKTKHIGGGQVPDDKSMSRFSLQLGAVAIEKLHQRVVAIAQEKKIIQGRKLRGDTTVDVATLCYTSLSL